MTRFKLAVFLALTSVPLQAKPRAPLPDAGALVLKALAGPSTGYAAVERVQVFLPGKKPKAIKVNITALPGRVRREVLPSKKKAAPLIQVRDREKAPAGLSRLRALYDLTVSTGGVVAKRKTWKIELRLKSGALRRALWMDRDSGLLMKRETYRDDGSLVRRERLVQLALPAPVDPASLKTEASSGPWMPDGFVFTGENGATRRYSNGLESYEIRLVDGKAAVSGDLAEDDASRILESASK
ncbi:MAG: sigma-E factor regulatory protein RseB domain-containing protein [Elusimicrobiota bacterium]